jgi:hypothetical protein
MEGNPILYRKIGTELASGGMIAGLLDPKRY